MDPAEKETFKLAMQRFARLAYKLDVEISSRLDLSHTCHESFLTKTNERSFWASPSGPSPTRS